MKRFELYIKVALGALFCLSLGGTAGSLVAAFLASKEIWVKGGVLADSSVATAQAHAAVPLFVVIAMKSAELARVKQLTMSYYSEEYGSRVEKTLAIMGWLRVDKMTVVLEASTGEKVMVHGGTVHLVLATSGAKVPVCGGDADCSSFEVDNADLTRLKSSALALIEEGQEVPLNTVERRRLEDGSSAECNFLPDRSMNKKGRLNVSSADPSAAPVLFWFEKEANISVATNRLIHAAVKSAVLHNRGSKVLVFSNSLDFSYFCAASSLSGWARERTLSATCQASVQRYDLGELLRPRDPVLAESVLKIANSVGSSKSVFGQMHLLSDIMRFVLLFEYGGTYMDIDQIFVRPLPALRPLLSREAEWNGADCNDPQTPIYHWPHCKLLTRNGKQRWIPGHLANPAIDKNRFILYSGLLANFERQNAFVWLMIESIVSLYTPGCWGCLGPQLVSWSFAEWTARHEGDPPAYTLSSSRLLLVSPTWHTDEYNLSRWLEAGTTIVDIDFHRNKLPTSMLAGLLERTLFVETRDADLAYKLATSQQSAMPTLADMVDELAFASRGQGSKASEAASSFSSGEFARLPWLVSTDLKGPVKPSGDAATDKRRSLAVKALGSFSPPPPLLPPPSPPTSPPPSAPPPCAKVTLPAQGWQMISFNCIGNMSNTLQVLETVSWKIDNKIITRDPFLKFATFDGDKFVGGLVNHDQLSMSLGYKIFYSGAPGAVLEQTGLPQLPVENVVLNEGWNWIGHAPLHTYPINAIESVGSSRFSVDDQIKTRAGSDVKYTTHTGGSGALVWQGNVPQLMPGIGYEFKVAQAVTFCYGKLCGTD